MVMRTLLAALFLLLASGCSQSQPGVLYQVTVVKDGQPLASPSLVGEFEQSVSFDVASEVRVEMSARETDGARAFVTAEIYLPSDGEVALAHRFESEMELDKTPSFQYTSEDKRYRIEIRPRNIELPPNRAAT